MDTFAYMFDDSLGIQYIFYKDRAAFSPSAESPQVSMEDMAAMFGNADSPQYTPCKDDAYVNTCNANTSGLIINTSCVYFYNVFVYFDFCVCLVVFVFMNEFVVPLGVGAWCRCVFI